jgi:hypothetical protein
LPVYAHSSVVGTEEVLVAADGAQRSKVEAFLHREDVQKALEAHGLSAQAALDRVQAMSDAEVQQLAGRVDQVAAGGDIVGVFFTIFVLLLITDILGLTQVFPFTRR